MKEAPLFAGIGGHQSAASKTDEWLTPPEIIAALGGWESFDLDPAAPIVQPYPTARETFTKASNGLMRAWFGRVWLNPPYSDPALGQFMRRMVGHGRGIALIFARTETDIFFETVWAHASAVLFPRGRLHFHFPDGRRAKQNAGAPHVLCAYGAHDVDVLAFCGIEGKFQLLQLPRGFIIGALEQSWREALVAWVRSQRGPVKLEEVYRAFAGHPKTRHNRNYRAKLRQALQRGPFERVERGTWRAQA